MSQQPMMLGALVTFRRTEHLAAYLETIGRQTRRLDRLVIVDNDPQGTGRLPLEAHLSGSRSRAAEQIHYLPQEENLGAAGGWAVGQNFLAELAGDDDWIVMLDDDDPPEDDDILERREAFATAMIRKDPRTAAVSGVGAFFDQTRGRLRRLADHELRGPVAVDYVGSNHFPLYRMGIMRQLGPFFSGLFLGYSELEYSLRVRRAGFNIYVDGEEVIKRRESKNRTGLPSRSRSRVRTSMPPWRVYYTTRNMVWMLRANGHTFGALRVSFRRGLGRGVSQVVVSPKASPRYFRAGLYGIVHGWTDVMGAVIDPDDETLRIRHDKITVRDDLALEPIQLSAWTPESDTNDRYSRLE